MELVRTPMQHDVREPGVPSESAGGR